MSRKRVEMNLYNQDIKERFLEEECKTKGTKSTYRKTFHRTSRFERMFDKDLFDFSQVQFIKMLINIGLKTTNSIVKEWATYNKYCKWAKKYGYKTSFEVQFNKEDLQELVSIDAIQSQYIHSLDELAEIMDLCINAQDSVILGLLFVGVRGRASTENTFEEILNLKKQDIDFNNNIITVRRNDGTTRKIENVPPKIMDVIKRAIECSSAL